MSEIKNEYDLKEHLQLICNAYNDYLGREIQIELFEKLRPLIQTALFKFRDNVQCPINIHKTIEGHLLDAYESINKGTLPGYATQAVNSINQAYKGLLESTLLELPDEEIFEDAAYKGQIKELAIENKSLETKRLRLISENVRLSTIISGHKEEVECLEKKHLNAVNREREDRETERYSLSSEIKKLKSECDRLADDNAYIRKGYQDHNNELKEELARITMSAPITKMETMGQKVDSFIEYKEKLMEEIKQAMKVF